MSIEIKEVKTKRNLKEFVNFPYRLYKNNKYWVPPLIKSELNDLTGGINPAFKICQAKFWLAFRDGRCAGRIGGIVNHKYNEKIGRNYARFTRPEFIDDKEVSSALFSRFEEWAREKNAEAIQGPLGFTNLDLQGLLVEGFDQLPSIASVYHQPYYREHIESLGYVKDIDWVEFRLFLSDRVPENIERIANLFQKRYKLTARSFKNKKELARYKYRIFDVFNEAFLKLRYTINMDEELRKYYADHFFSVLNPKFIKVVVDDEDRLQGFIIGLPSLSRAFQKAGGRLWPFGIFHIIRAVNKPDCIDLALTGVRPEYQNKGLAALLTAELQKSIMAGNIFQVETTGIFEDNTVAVNIWKNWKHIQHKRRRAYIKKFASN